MVTPKQQTLCLWQKDGQLLLGMKKRGFGAGRWNGFGGKVQPGESVEEAAKREMKEEVGIQVQAMEERGRLHFRFEKTGDEIDVSVFAVIACEGEPVESEEMRPQWFVYKDIPLSEMWPDDLYWIPMFLEGKRFTGSFVFGDQDVIVHKELTEVV